MSLEFKAPQGRNIDRNADVLEIQEPRRGGISVEMQMCLKFKSPVGAEYKKKEEIPVFYSFIHKKTT
jgi:hypothetical protein